MREVIKLNPMQMALLLRGIKDHLENPNDRPVVYQVAVGGQLYARLMEGIPKKFIDEFLNTMLEIGLDSWYHTVVQDNFQNNEEIVNELVEMACEEERSGARVH
uniref:Uncharacterized protein n=1 Tax=viral metagenome TaxID=1070528 RepID=A0A6M3LMG0_9ZZZZ